MVVRANLRKLIGRWENNVGEGRRLSYRRLMELTGVHKDTLSRLARSEVKYVAMDDIDALCRFFGVQVGELLTYIPDEKADQDSRSSAEAYRREVSNS